MPREFPAASYDNWKTTEPLPDEPDLPEEEEPEPTICDWCRREFTPLPHNIEEHKVSPPDLTCDTCLEELAMERPRRR
jgi:hypothetical protein